MTVPVDQSVGLPVWTRISLQLLGGIKSKHEIKHVHGPRWVTPNVFGMPSTFPVVLQTRVFQTSFSVFTEFDAAINDNQMMNLDTAVGGAGFG